MKAVPLAALAAALALSSCAPARLPGVSEGSSPGASSPAAQQGGEAPDAGRAVERGRATLAEGAEAVKGVPGFGVNALPALRGVYELGLASGTARAAVYFTRERLVPSKGWAVPQGAARSSGYALLVREEAEAELWLAQTADRALVVALPLSMDGGRAFVDVLLDRFDYFYRMAAREEDISFPASLDFRR